MYGLMHVAFPFTSMGRKWHDTKRKTKGCMMLENFTKVKSGFQMENDLSLWKMNNGSSLSNSTIYRKPANYSSGLCDTACPGPPKLPVRNVDVRLP